MIKERWMVIDTSIYTEKEYDVRFKTHTDEIRIVKHRKSIAFNIGEKVARHIVYLHNKSIDGTMESA